MADPAQTMANPPVDAATEPVEVPAARTGVVEHGKLYGPDVPAETGHPRPRESIAPDGVPLDEEDARAAASAAQQRQRRALFTHWVTRGMATLTVACAVVFTWHGLRPSELLEDSSAKPLSP